MSIDIALLDIDQAGHAELVDYHEMTVAVFAVDRPDAPAPSFEALIGRIRTPLPDVDRQSVYLARSGGHLVGSAVVTLTDHENTDQAMVDVRVHPAWRRRGIGTALLHAVLPALRADGRAILVSDGVAAGLAGEHWARALGATETFRMVLQRLEVADAQPALWNIPVPRGYRLRRWIGAAPADLLDSLAMARRAIEDMPQGDSRYEPPAWTAERVRQMEATAAERGIESRVVVAVHESSGDVVGLTEIQLLPQEPVLAFQHDTAVLAEHRGHGLGLAMKAAMLRWLLPDAPGIERVATSTAADNVHMMRINHALGMATKRVMIEFEIPIAALATVA